MELRMKILPWILLIVSISFSSAYQVKITCANNGCQIFPKSDDQKTLHEDRILYTPEIVIAFENIFTKKFEDLESNLLNFVTEELRNNSRIVSENGKRTVIESRASPSQVAQTTTSKKHITPVRTIRTPSDCWDIYEAGHKSNGVQTIYPQGYEIAVYCDMLTAGGGWTVFLNRQWQQVQENFTRSWQEYKLGFGDPAMEYWMGNEGLHLMTSSKDYNMRFDASSSNELQPDIWGEFNFKVASEASRYQLTIKLNNTLSNMDSEFYKNNGQFFTTYDSDNDKFEVNNCANLTIRRDLKDNWHSRKNGGGFWYNYCSDINPTAEYGGIFVKYWSKTVRAHGYATALSMKLRPKKASSPKASKTTLPTTEQPSDCWDIFKNGTKRDRLETIYPQGYSYKVKCDMITDGGGWTILLYRQWERKHQVNFSRSWLEYKIGFGNRYNEYWMGNEALHLMTTSKDYIMRLDAYSMNGKPRNIWGKFNIKVASEKEKYRLTIKRIDTTGNMDRTIGGGAFVYNNGQFFTTYDSDNDEDDEGNCATYARSGMSNGGGFWYKACSNIFPMGTFGQMLFSPWSNSTTQDSYAFDIKMMLRPKE